MIFTYTFTFLCSVKFLGSMENRFFPQQAFVSTMSHFDKKSLFFFSLSQTSFNSICILTFDDIGINLPFLTLKPPNSIEKKRWKMDERNL